MGYTRILDTSYACFSLDNVLTGLPFYDLVLYTDGHDVRQNTLNTGTHLLVMQSLILSLGYSCLQVDAELWKFPDRQTAIGQMINAYLQGKTETDDAAVHLLFSANRWEKRQAANHLCTRVCQPTARERLVSTEGSVGPGECL